MGARKMSNRFVERCRYDDKDVEIYQCEETGLWSAYVRIDQRAYQIGVNFPSREEIIYDLEYCDLARRNPRRKHWLKA